MMSNYNSAVERLNRCKSLYDVNRALKGFERVHKAGHLTDKELERLDAKAFDILFKGLERFDAKSFDIIFKGQEVTEC